MRPVLPSKFSKRSHDGGYKLDKSTQFFHVAVRGKEFAAFDQLHSWRSISVAEQKILEINCCVIA